MPTLTLKRIPEDVYRQLKRAAAAQRRSLNSEIIVRLERSLGRRPVDVAEILATANGLRQKTAGCPATQEELNRAKAAGRP